MTSFSDELFILRSMTHPVTGVGYDLFTDIELRYSLGSRRPYLALYEPLTQRTAYLSLIVYPQLISLLNLERLEGYDIEELPIKISHTQVIMSGTWKEHPLYDNKGWMWMFHPRVVIEVRYK